MRQGGGRRRTIARRERQRSLANKRPRRLVDFYLELVSYYFQLKNYLADSGKGSNLCQKSLLKYLRMALVREIRGREAGAL